MYLHDRENYSKYINDLIDKDRLDMGDQKFIDARILEHQQEIEHLKELKKIKHTNTAQEKEFLEYWLQVFRTHDRIHMEDHQNIFWIKSKIIPEGKNRGFKLNEKQVLQMFKEGKIE
jgi:hypothetical protein